MKPKVFGIGLNKTGTSTLGLAGEALGFKCKTWDASLFKDVIERGERTPLWATIDTHDLFNDFPYPLIYPELDARYPRAKFILTRRARAEDWLQSVKAHSMRARISTTTHKTVYGFQYPHGREQEFLAFYERHNAEARQHFENRQDDFLEICWEEEKGLARFADFLGVEARDIPVPQANASSGKRINPLRYAWNAGARFAQLLSRS